MSKKSLKGKAKAKGKAREKLNPTDFHDPEGYLRKTRPTDRDSVSEDSDASESEGSSDIGVLEAGILESIAAEMDSSEEDEFFNGKPTWADETEWFIQDMEVGIAATKETPAYRMFRMLWTEVYYRRREGGRTRFSEPLNRATSVMIGQLVSP